MLMISFRENTHFFFCCPKSAIPPKILHTYSIDTPYVVHRFDGVTMEKRWTCDGDASEVERWISGGLMEIKIPTTN